MLLTLGVELEPCGASVVIHDISSTGLSFATSTALDPGDVIEVRLPDTVPVRATVVRRNGTMLACRFQSPISKSALSAAQLQSEPLARTGSTAMAATDFTSVQPAPRRSNLGGMAIAAAALAGLSYLVITGAWTALAIVAGAFIAIGAVLVWCCNWAIDNV